MWVTKVVWIWQQRCLGLVQVCLLYTNVVLLLSFDYAHTAYFFLVAEAMIDTGVHMGFPRHIAKVLYTYLRHGYFNIPTRDYC